MTRRSRKLTLTVEQCRLMYRLLSETEPFNGWNMPDSSDVIFKVSRSRNISGYHKEWSTGEHEIGISARCVGTIPTLAAIMGHEMAHLHQCTTKPRTDTPGVEHNLAFRRIADRICEVHHFDRPMFAEID